MSAQARKEARALLPYWAGALAIVVAPCFLGRRGAELSWFSYLFGCALLGGVCFGQEFQHRTLAMLLALPLKRTVIWRQKMLVLAAALATCTAVLWGVWAAVGGPSYFDVRVLPLAPLCALCGAPFLTLWSGSALGGIILSMGAAGSCVTLAMILRLFFPALDIKLIAATLLIVFCTLAAVLGYVRFQSYEVRDRPSRVLGIPAWLLPRTSSRSASPLVALLSKEVRLQHATFAVAVVVWGFIFVGGVLSHWGQGNWRAIARVTTGLDLLVLPLIAGTIALGEERSLGAAEWQLCLPPSARLQWLAKMLVALPSSLLLGFVVPLLINREQVVGQVLFPLVLGHLLLTHLAIYAGSLAPGTISAILIALGMWSAVGSAILYCSNLLDRVATTPMFSLWFVPMLGLLQCVSFYNYRRPAARPGRILQGLVVTGLVTTFVILVRN